MGKRKGTVKVKAKIKRLGTSRGNVGNGKRVSKASAEIKAKLRNNGKDK